MSAENETPKTDALLGSAIDYPRGSEDIQFMRAVVTKLREFERALSAANADVKTISEMLGSDPKTYIQVCAERDTALRELEEARKDGARFRHVISDNFRWNGRVWPPCDHEKLCAAIDGAMK